MYVLQEINVKLEQSHLVFCENKNMQTWLSKYRKYVAEFINICITKLTNCFSMYVKH